MDPAKIVEKFYGVREETDFMEQTIGDVFRVLADFFFNIIDSLRFYFIILLLLFVFGICIFIVSLFTRRNHPVIYDTIQCVHKRNERRFLRFD